MAAPASLYNEDRNLLRIREKERRNQEAHQEKEEFPEKIPLFGEPYKKEKGDELSSRIQTMLGDYEEVKEFLSPRPRSCHPDDSEMRLGRPRYPEKGSCLPGHSLRPGVQRHPLLTTPTPTPLLVAPVSRSPKMAQPRVEPPPSVHARGCAPPDTHLAHDRLGQEGYGSGHPKKGTRRAAGSQCAAVAVLGAGTKLSPQVCTVPAPAPSLSPIPRSQGHGVSRVSTSPPSLVLRAPDKEGPQDSVMALATLGVTFPPPPLPSKSLAMQQKPTAYVRPMDGQDQAPSESPKLKPLPEDYRPHTLEKTDLKVPARAKLAKLKMPSQSVELAYPNEVHCVEEILKEMTHSWPPPLTAIHTPSTAEPSKFPFPTKDSQHIKSATHNQKQYDTSSQTHPNSQQGTSMLEDDLQLSDSEDSDSKQTSEKPPSSSAPPSASQSLPEAPSSTATAARGSSAESESTSDSDSSSDSESESSSSDSEENEPPETPAPEPEPPSTNKWQLDNWLTKVSQPVAPPEALGSSQDKDRGHSTSACSESKEPPPKSSSRTPRAPSEGSHTGKRSCQKASGHQEPPKRQTVGTKQPKRPCKALGAAVSRPSLQVESETPPPPCVPREQPSKDKPKVKTKGRPRSGESREPAPKEKKRPKDGPPAPPEAHSGLELTKDLVGTRHLTLVAPVHGARSRASSSRRTAPEESRRDPKALSQPRDPSPPDQLLVRITLDLLSQVPRPPGKGHQKTPDDKQPHAGKRLDGEKRSSDKGAKRSKGEGERDHDSKKVKLEKEMKSQSSSSSSDRDSSKTKAPRASSEGSRQEMLPPAPLTSSSSHKPAKPAQKRSRREAEPCGQDRPHSASSAKGSHKDPSVSKHRKVEGRSSGSTAEHKGSSGDNPSPFPVPSLPNGNPKPGKPPVKLEKQHSDVHMKAARRLKQKAEAMKDKVGKAFKYLEAALSFVEGGMALESEGSVSKAAHAVYSEALELVNFTMSLKGFPSATSSQEKIFAVLCLRCQSLLNMALFRCKKDTVLKYSRALNEHFQSSSRGARAPSPCIARNTGTPSSLSPMPSPAGSQASASGAGTSGMPVAIQNMTSAYVTITSHVLTAFELWEQAEVLTRKNKDVFAQFSTNVCALALNSSLTDLVQYTRQGLQQLKQ